MRTYNYANNIITEQLSVQLSASGKPEDGSVLAFGEAEAMGH